MATSRRARLTILAGFFVRELELAVLDGLLWVVHWLQGRRSATPGWLPNPRPAAPERPRPPKPKQTRDGDPPTIH